eukprot:snap_masked-scaffold192_size271026-processed-gene-1.8 protein:Tk07202 transcript:snap_masked-scaffold192_size271026-processed-gene-1.8-mRNA-1 annotation:"calcium-binding protein p-like"
MSGVAYILAFGLLTCHQCQGVSSEDRGVRFVSPGGDLRLPDPSQVPLGNSFFVIQDGGGQQKQGKAKTSSHVKRRGASALHVPPLGYRPQRPSGFARLGVPPVWPPPPPQPVAIPQGVPRRPATPKVKSYSELVLGSDDQSDEDSSEKSTEDSSEESSEESSAEESPRGTKRKRPRGRPSGKRGNRKRKNRRKKKPSTQQVYVLQSAPVLPYPQHNPFKQFTAPFGSPQHSFPLQSDYPGASFVSPDPNHYVSGQRPNYVPLSSVTPTPYPHLRYGPTPTPHAHYGGPVTPEPYYGAPVTPEPYYGAPVGPEPHYGAPVTPETHYGAPVTPEQHYGAPLPVDSHYGPPPPQPAFGLVPHYGPPAVTPQTPLRPIAKATVSYSHGDVGSKSHSYFEFSTPKPHYELPSEPPITFQGENDDQNFLYHFQTFPVQSSGVLPPSHVPNGAGGQTNFQGDPTSVIQENNNDGTFTVYTPPGLSITPVASGPNGNRNGSRRKKNKRRRKKNKNKPKNQRGNNPRRPQNNNNPPPYSANQPTRPNDQANESGTTQGQGNPSDEGNENSGPTFSFSNNNNNNNHAALSEEDNDEASEVTTLNTNGVLEGGGVSEEADGNTKFLDNVLFQDFVGTSKEHLVNQRRPKTLSNGGSKSTPGGGGRQKKNRRKNRKNKAQNTFFSSFPDTTIPSANLEIITTTLTPKLEIDISAENGTHGEGDDDYEYEYEERDYEYGDYNTPPEQTKYEYKYEDQNSAKMESRDGEKIEGSYHVALPDGRKQIVEYVADGSGFHAEVRYEGEAILSNDPIADTTLPKPPVTSKPRPPTKSYGFGSSPQSPSQPKVKGGTQSSVSMLLEGKIYITQFD